MGDLTDGQTCKREGRQVKRRTGGWTDNQTSFEGKVVESLSKYLNTPVPTITHVHHSTVIHR